jgi:hypothetical protein
MEDFIGSHIRNGVDMVCFRFMSDKWIDAALAGSFRLRSLSEYRLMEAVYEDEWIGDLMEGTEHIAVTGIEILSGDGQSELRNRLSEARLITMDDSSSVVIEDGLMVRVINGYVLCFAEGDFEQLKDLMCIGDYNSAIKIDDLNAFASCLYESGVSSKHGPIKNIFYPPEVGSISYTGKTGDIRYQNVVDVTAFVKREKYKSQSEIRIFFPLIDQSLDDPVDVEFSPPIGMIEEVFRCAHTQSSLVKKYDYLEGDAVQELLDILKEFESWLFDLSGEQKSAEFMRAAYSRRILLAYWTLRDRERCKNLEHFFVNPYWNGGAVTGVRMFLHDYLAKINGVDKYTYRPWS